MNRIACPVCKDYRFVTVRPEARRFIEGHGASSDVYPCPICGQAVFDADGKKYGKSGVRYGNPYMEREEDYAPWRLRNSAKGIGWDKATPSNAERSIIADLEAKYPKAKPEWVRAWVLGNRRLWPDQGNPPSEAELTQEERDIVAGWNAEGYRREDCLRWIEGRRYDPSKDETFLDACAKALAKAAFIEGLPEPSLVKERKGR